MVGDPQRDDLPSRREDEEREATRGPVSERLSEELKKILVSRCQGDVASDVCSGRIGEGRQKTEGEKLQVLLLPSRVSRAQWETADEGAGIHPGFHFHDLRHTGPRGSRWRSDDLTVMEILGHSDFNMMKRYAHLSPEHKRKAIQRCTQWEIENGPKMVPNAG